MERLVECGCELNEPVMNAHGTEQQLSRGRQKSAGVRRGGMVSYDITTHSTEARVSVLLIAKLDGLGVVCALGQFGR